MAITKILARKGRLDVGVRYVLNGDKTENQILTAHLNCDPGQECRQMLDTKRAVGKEDGVQYYHIIQSFQPGEVTPEQANVRLGLDTHKHRRSLNVLVIGVSGAGKSRSYVKPNILEANTNYVITDPKSEVLLATGGWLKENGYDIRVLNLVNLEQSDGYNHFRYCLELCRRGCVQHAGTGRRNQDERPAHPGVAGTGVTIIRGHQCG